jgi:hypothetical protein
LATDRVISSSEHHRDKRIDPQADGVTVHATGSNIDVSLQADKNHLPVRYIIESPVMKATMEPTYTSSPNRVPGDLNRLTGLKAIEQFGSSTINLEVSLDYQFVDGFNIPHKVSFGIGPALTVPLEFSACSVTKTMKVLQPSKNQAIH